MELGKTSIIYSLNKSTYVNLRWIAYIGQLIAVLTVQFILEYNFDYLICILVILFSVLTNLFLKFKIKTNQLNNNFSTFYLLFDILQLSILFYFTGGITNPFIFLIIIPAVFSSQYLHFLNSIVLVVIITAMLMGLITQAVFGSYNKSRLNYHTRQQVVEHYVKQVIEEAKNNDVEKL